MVDLAKDFGPAPVLPCDVADEAQIAKLFENLHTEWSGLDGLVHSIAFAPREALKGDILEGLTRDAFRIAHDVSSYSLAALSKAALPLMENRKAAVLTLTYLGAQRSVPNYNVMGLAKASLEANVRFLAADLGPLGIRVNGISAGPIKTLSSSAVSDFESMMSLYPKMAPLRRNVTMEEVGKSGMYLLSDLASGVTGETLHVDSGYHVMGAPPADVQA